MGKVERHTHLRMTQYHRAVTSNDASHNPKIQSPIFAQGHFQGSAQKHEWNSITQFNESLDNGLSKSTFDHLRNYLMCSFLLAIGIAEAKQKSGLFFDLVSSQYAGFVIIALSCVLFMLNLYDGIRKISQYKYHLIYTIGLVGVYAIMSIGVIEIAVSFRTAL